MTNMPTVQEHGTHTHKHTVNCFKRREQFFVPTHKIDNDDSVSLHTNKVNVTHQENNKHDQPQSHQENSFSNNNMSAAEDNAEFMQ